MEIYNKTIKYVNLHSIKSLYITKFILSFLIEKIKINIIRYNKNYQNKLGFDIEDYKRLSCKYQITDKNGIGRIYDSNNNKLFFKGKINGEGIELDENDNIIFEGQYLNGKKIKGKGYDLKGNIILEIEKNGKGKEYYDNGHLKFEGEYVNGRR